MKLIAVDPRRYSVVVWYEPEECSGYCATCLEIPGAQSHAPTEGEAVRRCRRAIREWLAHSKRLSYKTVPETGAGKRLFATKLKRVFATLKRKMAEKKR